MKYHIMNKVVLNESEQRDVDMITEEFKARGGGWVPKNLYLVWEQSLLRNFQKYLKKKYETIKDDSLNKNSFIFALYNQELRKGLWLFLLFCTSDADARQ